MSKEKKCRCCGSLENIENNVWDVSNGLTSIPVCNKCYDKIKKHVMAIEDSLKLPFWSVNIHVEERYNENVN